VIVRATRISEPIVVDGRPTRGSPHQHGGDRRFRCSRAEEGELTTERTEVWLLLDDRSILRVGPVLGLEPDREVANECAGWPEHNDSESFGVVFDIVPRRRATASSSRSPWRRALRRLHDERHEPRLEHVRDARADKTEDGYAVEMMIPSAVSGWRHRSGASTSSGWSVEERADVSHANPTRSGVGVSTRSRRRRWSHRTPKNARTFEVKPYGISD
jgi:hypothetical protein